MNFQVVCGMRIPRRLEMLRKGWLLVIGWTVVRCGVFRFDTFEIVAYVCDNARFAAASFFRIPIQYLRCNPQGVPP